jgi:hypothetical protein
VGAGSRRRRKGVPRNLRADHVVGDVREVPVEHGVRRSLQEPPRRLEPEWPVSGLGEDVEGLPNPGLRRLRIDVTELPGVAAARLDGVQMPVARNLEARLLPQPTEPVQMLCQRETPLPVRRHEQRGLAAELLV